MEERGEDVGVVDGEGEFEEDVLVFQSALLDSISFVSISHQPSKHQICERTTQP